MADLPAGVELRGERDEEILSDDALDFVADLQRTFGGRREELLAARDRPAGAAARRRAARLPRGDALGARGRLVAGRRGAARPAGPPRRDHRPDRPEDGDQRAQLAARASSWPTSRTRTRRRGRTWSRASGTWSTRSSDDLARHGREELQPERADRDAARPPARLAPARAARARRRRAGLGLAVRLRAVHVPLGQARARPRQRARTSTSRSSRATSRRGSGTTSSCTRRTRSASRAGRSARPS